MSNSLAKISVSPKMIATANTAAQNIQVFLKSFDSIKGIKIDVSVLDGQRNWHTLSQRFFANGSLHAKVK